MPYSSVAALINDGKPLSTMSCLDVFARDGSWHSHAFASRVKEYTAWEINGTFEEALLKNFPKANVRICDSFEQIKHETGKYDLVVIDNNLITPRHPEHFDLYPHIFKVLNDTAYVVKNVIPDPYTYRDTWPDELIAARNKFYGTNDPRGRASLDEMDEKYRRLADENGFIQHFKFTSKWPSGGVYTHAEVLVRKGSGVGVNNPVTKTNFIEMVKGIKATNILLRDQKNHNLTAGKYFAVRHDVDDDFDKSMRLAEIEAKEGIRATYFLLPGRSYFDYSEKFLKAVSKMASLGHEIGYHNDALGEWRVFGGQKPLEDIIWKPLKALRSLGIEVVGTACHGNPLGKAEGWMNFDLWLDSPREPGPGYPQGLPRFLLSHFGLQYEAYWLKKNAYLSDNHTGWTGGVNASIYHHEVPGKGQDKRAQILESFEGFQHGMLQILVHPQHWRFD